MIDARGGGGRGLGMPGGRIGGAGGLGVGGILIYLLIQVLAGGGGGGGFDVGRQFGEDPALGGGARGIPAAQDPERDLKEFSSYVFTDAQRSWQELFSEQGKPYERAKLVLFRDGVNTACGSASSSVGPFYCPGDQRVYLDLGFYRDMREQLGAQGDFAWAYVIAHEVGHHVQHQLGTSDEVRRLGGRDRRKANELSVRLELQADCFAGVWGHSVFAAGDLEEGDVEEAMNASQAIGDDRLQKRAGGRVNPDSFTHGTSDQRTRWFRSGQDAGRPGSCDTFAADEL